MTNLFLLLKDDYSLCKSYEIPTGDRAINYITVELEENSDIASHISDYTFMLIIKLPSGKKAAYALTPDEDNKFEKLAVPTAFSFFGEGTKVFIDIYNDSELVAQSDELSYVLQNVDKVVPTLLITENGIYDVTKYDKVNCDVIDPVNELNDGFEKTLVGSDDSGYEAQNSLSDNITQAISDFGSIKTAIENKGVQIPSGTPTSQYAVKISNIPTGTDTLAKAIIEDSGLDIIIPNGTTQIRKYCFFYANIRSVTIPDSVTSIGEFAFSNSMVQSFTLGSGVTDIPQNCFDSCGQLTSVTIPSGITEIKGNAFNHCQSLASITFPNGIKKIGNSAFGYCSALTTVTLPDSLEMIGERCFSDCNHLVSVTLPNANRFLYTTSNYLLQNCTALSSIVIPSGYTAIAYRTFWNCTSLATIYLPNTLNEVNGSAFLGCNSLSSVTLENGFNANPVNLSSSTLYTAQTIVGWLNALYDRTGLSANTLTIGATNLAKLTAEEIAIATNKNWNLA